MALKRVKLKKVSLAQEPGTMPAPKSKGRVYTPGELFESETFEGKTRHHLAIALGDVRKGEIYWAPSIHDTNIRFLATKGTEDLSPEQQQRVVFVMRDTLPVSKRASKPDPPKAIKKKKTVKKQQKPATAKK